MTTSKKQSNRKKKGNGNGRDAYQEVTDRIVAALESGTVPWHRPWSVELGQPRNINGRPYNGINAILLGFASEYSDPRWGTFKAIQEHGGKVRKGEKATLVVFFKPIPITEKDESGKEVKKTIPLLKYFYVFNVEQADGLELEPIVVEREHEPIEGAELVYKGYENAPALRHGGNSAHYAPKIDKVEMPKLGQFESAEAYYRVQFHELTHSTGHKSRLDRPELREFEVFGDECYSREELVAEIGSAMISASVGIEPDIDQSASYIKGWLKALQNDKKMVVSAASRAQKAADWILGQTAPESA